MFSLLDKQDLPHAINNHIYEQICNTQQQAVQSINQFISQLQNTIQTANNKTI